MRSIRVLIMMGLLATATTVRAQTPPQIHPPTPPSAQPACLTGVCAPSYRPVVDGPPRIDWKRGCSRPICNPCDLPQWGYFDCWTPWPYAPNWTKDPPPPLATPNPLLTPIRPAQLGR
jgi:hypothetical protein